MQQCIVEERSSDVTVRLAVVYKDRVCMQAGSLYLAGLFNTLLGLYVPTFLLSQKYNQNGKHSEIHL